MRGSPWHLNISYLHASNHALSNYASQPCTLVSTGIFNSALAWLIIHRVIFALRSCAHSMAPIVECLHFKASVAMPALRMLGYLDPLRRLNQRFSLTEEQTDNLLQPACCRLIQLLVLVLRFLLSVVTSDSRICNSSTNKGNDFRRPWALSQPSDYTSSHLTPPPCLALSL